MTDNTKSELIDPSAQLPSMVQPRPAENPVVAIISMIERAAINPQVDILKMEKLLEMQERILERNGRMAFASALAAMQEDMPEIEQNGAILHNNKLISKYAKFEDINEEVKPVLQKHGFAISFKIHQPEGKIEVTAKLSHREGHFEETSIVLPADTSGAKNAVQAQGSSVAYGKRYAMCALLNISSRGEDDDGQTASEFLDTEKAAEIDLLILEVKADKAKFLQYMGVDDVRHIRANEYKKAMTALNAKKKGAA